MTTKSFLGYDYSLGLPNMQIDLNGKVSTASSDGLGSPTELRMAGDEVGGATIIANYTLDARPSGPLVNLLQQNRIPWHQLNVPWE